MSYSTPSKYSHRTREVRRLLARESEQMDETTASAIRWLLDEHSALVTALAASQARAESAEAGARLRAPSTDTPESNT